MDSSWLWGKEGISRAGSSDLGDKKSDLALIIYNLIPGCRYINVVWIAHFVYGL